MPGLLILKHGVYFFPAGRPTGRWKNSSNPDRNPLLFVISHWDILKSRFQVTSCLDIERVYYFDKSSFSITMLGFQSSMGPILVSIFLMLTAVLCEIQISPPIITGIQIEFHSRKSNDLGKSVKVTIRDHMHVMRLHPRGSVSGY